MSEYDDTNTWNFVMRETDRAEMAARAQLLREKEEKERIAARVREEMRVKEDELHAALYREMKKQREKELRDIINNDSSMKAVNGENRVSQWHAHRDNKMRLAGEAFKKSSKRPLSVEEERSLLGFGTNFTVGEMMEKNNITAAHIWGHDSDQLVGQPGTVYKPPEERALGVEQADSEEADAAKSKPPQSVSNSILQFPSRDPKEWGNGMNLRYAEQPTRGDNDPSQPPQPTPPTEETHAGKLSSTVSPELRVNLLHSNKTDPIPPTYSVPVTEGTDNDKDKVVSQTQTHSILQDWNRSTLGTKKTLQKPTTTQLLRQHYARVLTSSKLPSKEVVDTCAAMTRFQEDAWARRHDASLLEKLLKRNKSNPEGGVLHSMMDQQNTFTALDAAVSATPKILTVKAPEQFSVSGDYFLCESGVFTYWENPSEMLKICIHNGAWVIGKSYMDIENENADTALIRSQGHVYELPHQVTTWKYRDDPNTEWKEADSDISVVEKTEVGDELQPETEVDPNNDEKEQDEDIQPDVVGAAIASGDWIVRKDPRSGREYYVNAASKKTVWDLHKELTGKSAPVSAEQPEAVSEVAEPETSAPPPPPRPLLSEAAKDALRSGAWFEKTDPRSGKPYYCNKKTKKSYWNIEKALAENP